MHFFNILSRPGGEEKEVDAHPQVHVCSIVNKAVDQYKLTRRLCLHPITFYYDPFEVVLGFVTWQLCYPHIRHRDRPSMTN